MPRTKMQLNALKRLQQQFRAAPSFDALHNHLIVFIKEQLAPESVVLLHSMEPVTTPSSSPLVLQIPVGQTGFYLKIERMQPFEADETLLADLVVALLATAPNMQSPTEPSLLQQQLLRRVNQAIVEQQRFVMISEVLAEGFDEAFPGVQGKLLLVNQETDKLSVQTIFGGVPTAVDRMTAAIDEVAQQVIDQKEVAVLREHVPPSVIVPIPIGPEVEALLVAEYPPTAVILASDVTSITILAGYMGIALSNKKLLKQAWQRANELETIYKVTESALDLKPLDPTLAEIHKKLIITFNAPTCYIALYDAETQTISFPYALDNGEIINKSNISCLDEKSLTAWVITHNQPYTTDDWHTDEKPVSGIIEHHLSHSLICVPMRADGEVLGAISIQSNTRYAFGAADFQSLMAVASHVAVIVKNARRYTTTRELVDQGTRDYMTAVALRQAIGLISTSLLEQEAVLNNLLLALSGIVTYDVAFVLLLENGEFHLAASRDFYDRPLRFSIGQIEEIWQHSALLQEIRETKTSIQLSNVHQDSRWQTVSGNEKVRSWLGTPLLIQDDLLGILMLNSFRENAFSEHEEWQVSTLATHAAVAVQNASLHQKTERQLAELSTLYEASAMMMANLDQDFVLHTVVTEMVRALKVDSCTILVWDAEQQNLYPAAHQNRVSVEQDEVEDDEPLLIVGLSTIEHLEKHPIIHHVFKTQKMYHLKRETANSPDEIALLEAVKFQSVLLVPLVRRQAVLGLLALGQVVQSGLSPSQLRLTQNLASQAAVAIEHAHLFGQAQRRIEELSAFHEIVLQLNTPLELKAVLDTITDSALKLIEASNLHIYLYDPETKQFHTGSALWNDGRREPAVQTLRENGLTTSVVKRGEPIVIDDAESHPLYQSEEAQAWGICAIAGFPLRQGRDVIGAFTVTYLYPHTFTTDELLLLNLLADQAAVAVKNARLFADSERRLRDMAALVDMAQQVTRNLKLKSVLQTTVQILQQLLSARASTITMLSEDKDELILAAATGVKPQYMHEVRMKLNDTVSGEVVRHGQLTYIRDTYEHSDFIFFDQVVRSLLVLPLITRDQVIGTLTVDSDIANAFTQYDIQLMTIAAAQVSVAIANARLFEELERRAGELSQAYSELKESDRLKDELVQNVSHELRTPLTFVKGYVDLLMDGEMGLVTADQMEALQIVSDKTNEITRLIHDIMALQRIDAGNLQLQEVSMADLIETSVMGHGLVADNRGINVLCQVAKGKGIVMMDKGRINQVLDNLIGNAIKFSPDGGTITVSMEEQENAVCVIVADQGIGLPLDRRERIFERFYQVDGSARRRFGGTGLGLAIVKRIIDAHHGEIWVESEENKGSTFYFTLPQTPSRVTSAEVI